MSDPIQKFPTVQTPQPFTEQGWRPKPFWQDQELDLAIKTAFDNIYGLQATSPQAVEALKGSKVSAGAVTVTGSMKGVATGLATLSNVVVSIDNGPTPTNMVATATPSTITPGSFDCYIWKPTSTSVTTPILATGSVLVRWHAWGT